MTELSLWLDYYNDIYSDFDSRHYLKRRVSEDFLDELRLAMKYKIGQFNSLELLLENKKRDEQLETVIVKSLKDFFSDRYKFAAKKCKTKMSKGFVMLFFGILVVIANSFIIYSEWHFFLINILKLLLEPAGWFLIWGALDFIFYQYNALKEERDFLKELSRMTIYFKSDA
jgi:hypothetical protein